MESFRLWEQTQLPSWLYHVTPAAHAIFNQGFLPASKHGQGQTLGGPEPDAISFTDNLETAQDYRDGLELMQRALRGEYDWDDPSEDVLWSDWFGIPVAQIRKFRQWVDDDDFRDVNSYYKYNPRKLTPEKKKELNAQKVAYLLRRISLSYSSSHRKRMPWIFANYWDKIKSAPGFDVVKISTQPGNGKPGPQKYEHKPGENEWRVYDPENFDYSTLNKI